MTQQNTQVFAHHTACVHRQCPARIRLTQKLMVKLHEAGVEIPVVVGDAIPEQDIPALHQLGVSSVFLPNTPLEDVVREVTAIVEKAQQGDAIV